MTLWDRCLFRFAAWRNDDAVLGRSASSIDEIAQEMAGKRIAIVGNARALAKSDLGVQIDTCDLVIRINRAPMPSVESHGARTDWLALATALPRDQFQALEASRLIWMSHKRKRLKYWMGQTGGFILFPRTNYEALKVKLGAQPTTGAMLLDFAAQSNASEIHLFGFDFFSSLSLSGRRDAASVPHNFTSESDFVHSLIKSDHRVTLHPME
ncbi:MULTISPECIES: glycosyltransferase family 29 protein [Pacificibacter]|uniref:glycosyltransferase family 29 protein n=1 Tax=Pacificibacter TaxID=1042323 RepID=UPI001C094574|nr:MULTISPECIES: glycosyltransferase family 29 protein [Pacificibacter]MBU2937259.1 glycosyltransferase family 29 protein [Pacificibacter marinus]MDO6615254.1 glycosyltransferase family 29 protein [Pacificibacter sp. 1_MG-2023]